MYKDYLIVILKKDSKWKVDIRYIPYVGKARREYRVKRNYTFLKRAVYHIFKTLHNEKFTQRKEYILPNNGIWTL